MQLWQLLILAVVQGLAELLPISSSAHVIVAEKLLGLDPTSPQMTLLLVMLHTGTMFAVLVYFWKAWRATYFSSRKAFVDNARSVVIATVATALVGLALLQIIKHLFTPGASDFEIENLFGNARLMAASLAAAGLLIIWSSRARPAGTETVSAVAAGWIGAVQGVCLPFRGFSRSGATISTGMLLGIARRRAEEFSFALAVVLTPPVIAREVLGLHKAHADGPAGTGLAHGFGPGLIGMVLSFAAGMVALRWLSRWLEQGRWYLFGAYCLVAAAVVLWLG